MKNLFYTIFLSLNVLFLTVTAIWFRIDHAMSDRFDEMFRDEMMDDLQYQYSLRSNLLLWGSACCAYLLYLQEIGFLLVLFTIVAIVSVVTDFLYQYPNAPLYNKSKKGHRMAAVIMCVLACVYFLT